MMKPIQLFLATDNGLALARKEDGGWQATGAALDGHRLTCALAAPGLILAGTTGGLWRSMDGADHWQHVADGPGHVRWLAGPADRLLAGTEPAGIYRSADGGRTWLASPEVAEMRQRFHWFLPYSPEAGCVRGFAVHGQRVYAAVEVGGLLRSDDGGQSWRLVEGSDGRPDLGGPGQGKIHPDVHSIEVHPSDPDRLYAPTGGGFFVSTDGGAAWSLAYPRCYCRAVWVDPGDRDHLVLGTADSVDRGGRVERSTDGGRSWQPAGSGLDTPWPRFMVERFTAVGDELLAVLSNGRLVSCRIGRWQWRPVLENIGSVRGLAAVALPEEET
jgi:photosystem II stability/assembly factor-like uncharacterized protein